VKLSLLRLYGLLVFCCVSFSFAGDYEEMLAELGKSFRNNADPYVGEYENKDPLTRFPTLIEKRDNLWMIDNFRNSKVGVRKGQLTEDGKRAEKTTMDIQWTSALIDVNKVKKVSFVMTMFNTKIGPKTVETGHAQMCFEFADGGVMTPEGPIDSLVNSYEGFRDQGTIFNPIKGMFGAYESIFVMGSFPDVLMKALTIFNGLRIYELNLDHEQMVTLLKNTLQKSTDLDALGKVKYHTTRSSCVTNQINLLNSVLPEEQHIKEYHTVFGIKLLKTLGSMLPSKIKHTLKKKGLIKSELSETNRSGILAIYDQVVTKLKNKQDQNRIFQELYQD
jgi:hypothetical protein